MAAIQKTQTQQTESSKCCQQWEEIGSLAVVTESGAENTMTVPQNINTELPSDPATPLLSAYP